MSETTIQQQTDLRDALDSADSFLYSQQITGLTEETVRKISAEQQEPQWMLDHRLASLKKFYEMSMPTRGPSLEKLNLDEIVYFAKPENSEITADWDEVDPKIKEKFQRLGIPEAEQRYLA
jgi:Fe-S cluster assembly protein SufB